MNNHDYMNHIIQLQVVKLASHAGNLSYYAGIMLDTFHDYYAQNYAGMIGTSLYICTIAR